MDLQKITQDLRLTQALALKRSQGSYLGYLNSLVIDSAPEPRLFREVARPWQWEDARLLTPAIEAVAFYGQEYQGVKNFAWVRARGHDKTTAMARAGVWMLGFSRRRISWVHTATDGDQAALLLEAMSRQLELNPWLQDRVQVKRGGAEGSRGKLVVMTSDAASAFGELPDLITVDELTWWRPPSKVGPPGGLWGALWSARDKRAHCVVVLITNAGVIKSWQHSLIEAAKLDQARWYVWDKPERLETWMDEAEVLHSARLLPPILRKRVIYNQWVDPGEESGYLTRAEIQACEIWARDLGIVPLDRGVPGHEYTFVVDYGPKKDRTVLAVMYQDIETRRVHVAQMEVREGREWPDGKVPILHIRTWIEVNRRRFPSCRLVVDPYQLEDLCQELEKQMPVTRFEARGGKANYEMAECLRSCIINRTLLWYPGCGDIPTPNGLDTLQDELASLVLRPMTYGYRFDHLLTLHDDRAVVLGMGCVAILNRPGAVAWVAPVRVAPEPERSAHKLLVKPRRFLRRNLWGSSEL